QRGKAQQRRATRSINDPEIAYVEPRIPPIPSRSEGADLDRLPDLLPQHVGDLVPAAFQLRKDQIADREQKQAEGDDQRDQHANAYPQRRARQGARSSRCVGTVAQQRHDRLGRVILPLEPPAALCLAWTSMPPSSSAFMPRACAPRNRSSRATFSPQSIGPPRSTRLSSHRS